MRMSEKKEFVKAEIEVIRFEKTDVIATSGCEKNTMTIIVGGEPVVGCGLDEENDNE